MKKVVYIQYLPLTEKFVKDYYFEELEKEGIEVEFWDITSLFFKKIDLPNQSKTNHSKKVLSYYELKKLLKLENKNKTLFIPQLTYEWRVIYLFFIFTLYKCKLGILCRGALPYQQHFPNKIKNSFRIRFKTEIYKIINKTKFLTTYGLKRIGIIKTFDYLFNGGEQGYVTIGTGNNLDKIYGKNIQINLSDYDFYLEKLNINNRINDEKYIVFLDEYLPFHPDFLMFKTKTIDPTKYFNSLNLFFESIEIKFNLKVIIAAHPKSDYKINPFNGRLIVKFKTCELVKYSELVIAHMSTSISFAVLFDKPLIFLTTNDYININQSSLYNYTLSFAFETGSKIINADNYSEKELIIQEVDKIKYNNYKYNYLTSKESENKLSSEIFVESIIKL